MPSAPPTGPEQCRIIQLMTAAESWIVDIRTMSEVENNASSTAKRIVCWRHWKNAF